jgi:hypothetical protein
LNLDELGASHAVTRAASKAMKIKPGIAGKISGFRGATKGILSLSMAREHRFTLQRVFSPLAHRFPFVFLLFSYRARIPLYGS